MCVFKVKVSVMYLLPLIVNIFLLTLCTCLQQLNILLHDTKVARCRYWTAIDFFFSIFMAAKWDGM